MIKRCLHPVFLALNCWPVCAVLSLISCRKLVQQQNPEKSAVSLFNEVWTVIDQRYALFPVKSADWSAAYQAYYPGTGSDIGDDTLFLTLGRLLETLQDGHVSLISPSRTVTYDHFYTGYAANFNFNNLVNNYLRNDYRQTGPVLYTIRDSIGYLYYHSFENTLSPAALDTIFSFLGNTHGLIVDIRNNTGGSTQSVRRLFQRFLPQRKLVEYEVRKNGSAHGDFAAPEAQYVDGVPDAYSKPVCVLVNRSCYSACNDFALFMSQLPNVTLVGDQTGGGGGVPARYILANGWILQYTATMSLSPDQVTIEDGIQPNINIGISNLEEQAGKDPILEKAFSVLR